MLNSTINYSDIRNANRLDAEYFQPKFLRLQKKLEKSKYKKLGEVCVFINTGPAGSNLLASLYAPHGIKVCRPSNLNGWNCENGNSVFISEENCKKNNLQIYENEDLLIARIGDVKFGIIDGGIDSRYTISPNLFAMRLKKDLMDPYFMLAFLNSKFGLPQIQQREKLTSLASVGLDRIADILVPAIFLKEQLKIGNIVRSGLKKMQLAKLHYSEAEKILMQSVGCRSERSRSLEINIIKLRDTRRGDAEYFLARKYIIPQSIKSARIGEIARISGGIEPGGKAYQKSGKLFLRVSNISKYGLLKKSQKYISVDLYKKLLEKYQPRAREVLFVKDGKPGVAFVVNKPIDGIISEGIVRLKIKCHAEFISASPKILKRVQNDIKHITPEYISLCINSPICQSQIQADRDGSLMPHLKIEQIKELRIPVIPPKERKMITDNIKKSLKLFQESNDDLDQAVKKLV